MADDAAEANWLVVEIRGGDGEMIDTHMIMPGEPVRYWLDVTVGARLRGRQSTPAPLQARPATAPRRGPGWYRGDLHTHTNHSDAETRAPSLTLCETARASMGWTLSF